MNTRDTLSELEGLARLGYAARGLVYLIVGWFALTAARDGGRLTDTKGALVELFHHPFGAVLIGLVALGLAGYALWRIIQGALDVDRHGTSWKGLAIRGGQVVTGIVHAALAVFAVGLLAGRGGGNDGETAARDWTVWLMAMPAGQYLVAAVGAAIAGAAIAHFVKAYKASFRRHLALSTDRHGVVCTIGRVGLTAKGVVFALVGAFFIHAAWHGDSSESGGIVKALRTVQEQSYGPWLLGLVAAGLIAFGLFSLVQAVYRRIDTGEAADRLRAMA
ncbi:MAG TPA: DUF1206 domain-containing protein [Azospirillum sp.]